jgi:hypothetical protein
MSLYQTIFLRIIADPRYLANLDWGESRPGHPEGTVRAHIAELEQNLELLQPKLIGEEADKLKILIHTHDSFKAEAHKGVAILHPISHASLARTFLAEFCDDDELLNIVQYHDEPYALYRQFESKGSYNAERFSALISVIPNWDLFLAFNIIDGCTVGKSRDSLRWLFREIEGQVVSRFTNEDIIE